MFLSLMMLALAATTEIVPSSVTVDDLQSAMKRNDVVIVDVRGTVPYDLGHIQDAISIPLGAIEARSGELPHDKLIVAYCACKLEESSREAASKLTRLGFERVASLRGGYNAWKAARLPVVEASPEIPADEPAAPAPSVAARGRLAPPSAVTCDRNSLTSYEGRVTKYRPGRTSTRMTIRTDEGTTETVTLHHPNVDPSSLFLANAEPMTAEAKARIFTSRGTLLPNMRVIAWVCLDSKHEPVIDWRPSH